MLTGSEILKRIQQGSIVIDPFDISNLNPNSYNLTLANELKVYTKFPLDITVENPTEIIEIPPEGYVLYPGTLYLGCTKEYTEMEDTVGCIDGRSSVGRLGIMVHLTAGFGDIGYKGRWTLEISVVHPVRIYPGMKIAQIYFEDPVGSADIKYNGKYMNQTGPIESKMFKEYGGNE